MLMKRKHYTEPQIVFALQQVEAGTTGPRATERRSRHRFYRPTGRNFRLCRRNPGSPRSPASLTSG